MSSATLEARLKAAEEVALLLTASQPGSDDEALLQKHFDEVWADLHRHAGEDLMGALVIVKLVLRMRLGFIKARAIPAEDLVAQAVAAGESQNAYAFLMEAIVKFEELP